MGAYLVKYRIKNTTTSTILQLEGGTESEAVMKLKRSSTVPKDADVIVLSIQKK